MSLMGTLAKVAVGYMAARGVDRLSGGQGLTGLFGGAQVPGDEAEADHAPGIGNMQDVMAQMAGAAGFDLSETIGKFTGAAGFDLASLMQGATPAGQGGGQGGMFASAGEGAGLAGIFAAMGGAAASGTQTVTALMDQFGAPDVAPQMEESAGLLLRAMIQAAKADGRIDEAEQEKIIGALGDNADAGDIAFVRGQIGADVDVDALADDTPAAMAMQVYSMSLLPIRVDTDGEARYLDRLAAALGLTRETVNGLHMQMGVKALYP